MSQQKSTLYLHICTDCGQERYTKKSSTPSGLCRLCAVKRAKILPRHFLPGALYAEETVERFWTKVDKNTACVCHPWHERCWLWTGEIAKDGYGSFSLSEVQGQWHHIAAHRFAFQSQQGQLADGIWVLHQPPCLLRDCIRHLYAGTPQQNTDDAKAMQRFPTGKRHAALHKGYASLPRGERHAAVHHGYVAMPRGEEHWTHKTPELIHRGEEHWTHTNPEKMPHGESHWTHITPERMPCGDKHWSHVTPERVLRGERHHQATTNETTVIAIRGDYAAGMRVCDIAIKHNRSQSNVCDIVHRKIWRHIF